MSHKAEQVPSTLYTHEPQLHEESIPSKVISCYQDLTAFGYLHEWQNEGISKITRTSTSVIGMRLWSVAVPRISSALMDLMKLERL